MGKNEASGPVRSSADLDESATIARSADSIEVELDAETVVMNVETGEIISLSDTGRAIWQRLESERTIADVVGDLVRVYETDVDQCRSDVIAFCLELSECRFLEIRRV